VKPSAFSLQPSAFSLQPSAFSLQPSAFSLQPSAFSLLSSDFWLLPLASYPTDLFWNLSLLGKEIASLWACAQSDAAQAGCLDRIPFCYNARQVV
jgi:hypothetical protein